MKHEISFYGSVTTGANKTLVSQLLRFPYVVEKIRVKFALGHSATTQHRFFVSPDKEAPTGNVPTGRNILSQWGNVDYVVGDDDVLDLKDETHVVEKGTYLKVYASNSDSVTHTVNVIMTIDDLRIHPSRLKIIEMLKDSKRELETDVIEEIL